MQAKNERGGDLASAFPLFRLGTCWIQIERWVRKNAHKVELQTKLARKEQAIWGHRKSQLCQETVTQYRVVIKILFSI